MSNNDKIQLTKEGLAEIKKEYQELLEVKRPKIVERLAEARQMGDLSENNEYTTAREELAFTDGRLEELKEVLDRAELIGGDHKCCGQVAIGCKVKVVTHKNDEHTFHLVGEWEADPVTKKISFSSPLGKSLMGKKVGEKVEVEAPAGKVIYTITEII